MLRVVFYLPIQLFQPAFYFFLILVFLFIILILYIGTFKTNITESFIYYLFCRRPEKIPQIKMRTGPLFLLNCGPEIDLLNCGIFFFFFIFRLFFNGLQIIYGNSWYTKLRTENLLNCVPESYQIENFF